MNNEWEEKKLREVCEISPPKKNAKKKLEDTDMVSFLPMEDLGILTKEIHATKERPLEEVIGSYTYFEDCDVLLAKITPCFENGKIGIAQNLKKGTGFGSSEYIVFRSKGDVIPDYLYYFLSRSQFRQEGEKMMMGAVGHKRVSKDFIENYILPFPKSLSEQQRIVAILDESFATIASAIENTEKNLQNVRELFESQLQSVFTTKGDGWIEKPFGELATFRNGINFTKTSRGDSAKIVGVKDFQKNFWAPLDNLDIVTMEGTLPESDKLKENDILFVRSNGNMELIGRCLLIGKVTDKITYSGFTIRARLYGNSVMPKYLCHFLKSNSARRKMIDSGIGTNIKSLNQPTLSALVIPFPSVTSNPALSSDWKQLGPKPNALKASTSKNLQPWRNSNNRYCRKPLVGNSQPMTNSQLAANSQLVANS